MKKLNRTAVLTVTGSAVLLATLSGVGGAVAANQIGSRDIANGSIRSIDIKDSTIKPQDLAKSTLTSLQAEAAPGAPGEKGEKGDAGETGPQGETGPRGPKGDDNLVDAYYSVAYYDVGNTNAGAIATVACQEQTDVAISGGVQVTGIEAGANSRNTPVSSSFPGRMDWSTNTPKADRLDGWIVQFGGNAQTSGSSDKSPEKVKVWALCVPGAEIPVVETYRQSS
ncbi:collagen-like protein [Nocardioides sp. YIM 152588]|uniref:collagen-like triple helix repeat-containing protein n=1 Tax=Nocardioides sp. YIM 152588 TaxID=3158259 RepID=UPI0032E4D3CB